MWHLARYDTTAGCVFTPKPRLPQLLPRSDRQSQMQATDVSRRARAKPNSCPQAGAISRARKAIGEGRVRLWDYHRGCRIALLEPGESGLGCAESGLRWGESGLRWGESGLGWGESGLGCAESGLGCAESEPGWDEIVGESSSGDALSASQIAPTHVVDLTSPAAFMLHAPSVFRPFAADVRRGGPLPDTCAHIRRPEALTRDSHG